MTKNFTKREATDFSDKRALNHYFCINFLFKPYFYTFYRFKVEGKENIPKDKSFIAAANHLSHLDPPLVTTATERPIAFMAKHELFKVPLLSGYMWWMGAFAVNRENLDVSTIKTAKAVTTTKWILSLFPQGGRRKPGKIEDINKGFAAISKATKTDVLPIAILGSEKYSFIPWGGKITVKIGKPIPYCKDPEEMMDKWGRAVAELSGYEYVQPVREEKPETVSA